MIKSFYTRTCNEGLRKVPTLSLHEHQLSPIHVVRCGNEDSQMDAWLHGFMGTKLTLKICSYFSLGPIAIREKLLLVVQQFLPGFSGEFLILC